MSSGQNEPFLRSIQPCFTDICFENVEKGPSDCCSRGQDPPEELTPGREGRPRR